MFRIDTDTASPALAPPSDPGTPGYFGDGNPATAEPPTTVPAEWFNMIQEELIAVIAGASIALAKGDRTQLFQAINHLIAASQPQEWQDVTGSRVSGTVYTNTTGRPIQVLVVFPDTNGITAYADVVVGGVTLVNHAEYDHDTSTASFSVTFTVPAGATYSATATGGTIGKWCELS